MFKSHPIINSITTFIFAYMVLYALYIQINGEVSPGGGFQAGVIFASSIIGLDLISNKEQSARLPSTDWLIQIAALGVMLYASVGLISLFFGDNYLNYYSLLKDKLPAQSLGIFLIELGVGLTVASVMSLIYFLFKGESDDL